MSLDKLAALVLANLMTNPVFCDSVKHLRR